MALPVIRNGLPLVNADGTPALCKPEGCCGEVGLECISCEDVNNAPTRWQVDVLTVSEHLVSDDSLTCLFQGGSYLAEWGGVFEDTIGGIKNICYWFGPESPPDAGGVDCCGAISTGMRPGVAIISFTDFVGGDYGQVEIGWFNAQRVLFHGHRGPQLPNTKIDCRQLQGGDSLNPGESFPVWNPQCSAFTYNIRQGGRFEATPL